MRRLFFQAPNDCWKSLHAGGVVSRVLAGYVQVCKQCNQYIYCWIVYLPSPSEHSIPGLSVKHVIFGVAVILGIARVEGKAT
jgi:hypothetical protein